MSGVDWHKLWNEQPRQAGDKDYFKQVLKTVKGQPLSQVQFDCMLGEIRQKLGVQAGDAVLDLCCGNGLITHLVAADCRQIVGVDFSQPLIDVANRDHRPANATYHLLSVLELDRLKPPEGLFDKVMMYDALQHFDKRDLQPILTNIMALSGPKRRILLGGLPDPGRKGNLYNTPKRMLQHWVRTLRKREVLGTWWPRGYVESVCRRLGLRCEFHRQSDCMYNAAFRYDVVITTA